MPPARVAPVPEDLCVSKLFYALLNVQNNKIPEMLRSCKTTNVHFSALLDALHRPQTCDVKIWTPLATLRNFL